MKLVWRVLSPGMLVLVAVVALAVAVRVLRDARSSPPRPMLAQSHLLSIERIQSLAVLTTLKIEMADAQVTELQGYTGAIKAVLVIKGDVTIGVDLSAARFQSVDEANHRAVLLLPQPRLQSVRLDHEKTKLIGVWPQGLWQIVPGGQEADTVAINLAYRDGQRAISAVADDPALLDRSRRQCQGVLQTFFSALGWDVEMRWQD